MKVIKFLPLLVIFLFGGTTIKSQQQATTNSSDSLTLAQAFINLSLTETYFDSISLKRIDKIISYEENELKSIKTKTFKDVNATVYNMAWSMWYINRSMRFTKITTSPTRKQLLKWKTSLDSAYYFFSKANVQPENFVSTKKDAYYELLGFNIQVYDRLNNDLYGIYQLFSTYFNKDIYPDFKRIFYTAKNTNEFHLDSLQHYLSLYQMETDLNIVQSIAELKTSLKLSTTKNKSLVQYQILPALELISQYLQFAYLASNHVSDTIKINRGMLYNAYEDFLTDLKTRDPKSF